MRIWGNVLAFIMCLFSFGSCTTLPQSAENEQLLAQSPMPVGINIHAEEFGASAPPDAFVHLDTQHHLPPTLPNSIHVIIPSSVPKKELSDSGKKLNDDIQQSNPPVPDNHAKKDIRTLIRAGIIGSATAVILSAVGVIMLSAASSTAYSLIEAGLLAFYGGLALAGVSVLILLIAVAYRVSLRFPFQPVMNPYKGKVPPTKIRRALGIATRTIAFASLFIMPLVLISSSAIFLVFLLAIGLGLLAAWLSYAISAHKKRKLIREMEKNGADYDNPKNRYPHTGPNYPLRTLRQGLFMVGASAILLALSFIPGLQLYTGGVFLLAGVPLLIGGWAMALISLIQYGIWTLLGRQRDRQGPKIPITLPAGVLLFSGGMLLFGFALLVGVSLRDATLGLLPYAITAGIFLIGAIMILAALFAYRNRTKHPSAEMTNRRISDDIPSPVPLTLTSSTS